MMNCMCDVLMHIVGKKENTTVCVANMQHAHISTLIPYHKVPWHICLRIHLPNIVTHAVIVIESLTGAEVVYPCATRIYTCAWMKGSYGQACMYVCHVV